MAAGIRDADVVYVTRIQKERFESPEVYERVKDKFVITPKLLNETEHGKEINGYFIFSYFIFLLFVLYFPESMPHLEVHCSSANSRFKHYDTRRLTKLSRACTTEKYYPKIVSLL